MSTPSATFSEHAPSIIVGTGPGGSDHSSERGAGIQLRCSNESVRSHCDASQPLSEHSQPRSSGLTAGKGGRYTSLPSSSPSSTARSLGSLPDTPDADTPSFGGSCFFEGTPEQANATHTRNAAQPTTKRLLGATARPPRNFLTQHSEIPQTNRPTSQLARLTKQGT